jgi:hypothetical protein
MVHSRPTLPSGHGELTLRPAFEEWGDLLAANRQAAAGWRFTVAGLDVAELRSLARAESVDVGVSFSARLGVALRAPGDPEAPIVATGHQPQLYHPGVWVKDFLLDRVAVATGATALDIVVDTDGFDVVAVTSPCIAEGIDRCRHYLAVGAPDSCFASTPVPSLSDVDDFCTAGEGMLATLPAPSVGRHFSAFCDGLRSSLAKADNLAELVTMARRRYEASASTGYLEAPLTRIAWTRAFLRFVVQLAFDAARFSETYNVELGEYRVLGRIRSAAQPFPDLKFRDGAYELPLWSIASGVRSTLWAAPGADGTALLNSESGVQLLLPADSDAAVETLIASGMVVAPKALALTLFVRMFVCDLFIHGIGGGRYDLVTDGVIRRYFGVEPPRFAVASLTMYLPLGAHSVSEEEVAAAKARLNRLDHNPDALLSEIEFDSQGERDRALELAAEKRALVGAIAEPGADKKQLGGRIREVNVELSSILLPLREEYTTELEHLEGLMRVTDILTDRTYPFCFWDPGEIADKLP